MERLENINRKLTVRKNPSRKLHLAHSISSIIRVYEQCLHSYETRSPDQISKNNQKILTISNKNIARIRSQGPQIIPIDKQKYKNCLFICLHGIPSFKDQFQSLALPGEAVSVYSNGFQLDKDELYVKQNLSFCKFSANAEKIHEIISNQPNKNIVFVYHSFGTYNLSVYFSKYGVQRVKGLIQIGAAPIRQYSYITEVAGYCQEWTEEDIRLNTKDVVGSGFRNFIDKINKELNIKWKNFPSTIYAAAFLTYFKSLQFPVMFQLNRRYPNVLKLMIFGQQDNLFEKDLLCERAEFYCRQNLTHESKMKQFFPCQLQTSRENLQQNFIFMIPDGKHSLHMQKKNNLILANAVREYLSMILE